VEELKLDDRQNEIKQNGMILRPRTASYVRTSFCSYTKPWNKNGFIKWRLDLLCGDFVMFLNGTKGIAKSAVNSTLHVLPFMKSTSFMKLLKILLNGGMCRNCGKKTSNPNLEVCSGLPNL